MNLTRTISAATVFTLLATNSLMADESPTIIKLDPLAVGNTGDEFSPFDTAMFLLNDACYVANFENAPYMKPLCDGIDKIVNISRPSFDDENAHMGPDLNEDQKSDAWTIIGQLRHVFDNSIINYKSCGVDMKYTCFPMEGNKIVEFPTLEMGLHL